MTSGNLVRILRAAGVVNCRDLGGIPTGYGPLAPDRLFRCGSLAHLPLAAQASLFSEIPPGLYVDLRTDAEVSREGGLELASAAGWHWLRRPLDDSSLLDSPTGASRLVSAIVDQVLAASSGIASSDAPLVIACSLGKDRTGFVIGHLLRRLGCPREVVLDDYLLSNVQLRIEASRLPERYRSSEGRRYFEVTKTGPILACLEPSRDACLEVEPLAKKLCGQESKSPPVDTKLHRRRHDRSVNLSSNVLLHHSIVPLLQRARERIDAEMIYRYPDFAAAADAFARVLNVPTNRILLCPGTDIAIRALVANEAHRRDGLKRVLLQYPNYYAWEQAVPACGLPLTRVGWAASTDQGPSLIYAAERSAPALVALSFPNGPIGGAMTLDQLDQLVATCEARGHRLVIDSCYAVFDRPLPDLRHRWAGDVLILTSLSKSHGLAGCRIGTITAPPHWIAELAASRIEHAVSAMSIALALNLIEETPALTAIWDEIAATRKRITTTLSAAGYTPIPSGGNFLSFDTGSPAEAARVLSAMSDFGYRLKSLAGVAGYQALIRMTIGDFAQTEPAVSALVQLARHQGHMGAG